jgi:hypothetical protein
MFVNAIETAAKFTRPIHFITRPHGLTTVVPGAATLFFVNDEGDALTCAHVAREILAADAINARHQQFRAELEAGRGKVKLRQLEKDLCKKFGLAPGVTIALKVSFVNCIEGDLNADVRLHPELDVAILRFRGFKRLAIETFPVFARDGADLKQGKMLVRLGFPFAEFSNFEYRQETDSIEWTATGRTDTPQFPIEGMLTRHLAGLAGEIVGFEMSTPGLRGQSGGPAIDVDGRVWGMQAATAHLDLSFDIDQDVLRNGQKKRVRESAFLNVGHCVHVNVLKAFMREQGVPFSEA